MSIQLIQQYYSNVDKLIRYGGTRNEMSLRKAFQELLDHYARSKNLVLVPEVGVLGKRGRTVHPDGTLKDALRQDWGYWESKDEKDTLEDEMRTKFAKGYPDFNILFEDTHTAVLIQGGNEIQRAEFSDANALDALLTRFVNYQPQEVREFHKAILLFSAEVGGLARVLRDVIEEQVTLNPSFQAALGEFLELAKKAINPKIEMADVREMIIQHVLTEDIFMRVFDEAEFHRENVIAHKLAEVAGTFYHGETKRNIHARIAPYYETINARASQIQDHHEKQKFLKALYESFYKAYNPKAADRLGIVYTPDEIVRFMIESADHLVYKHFGKTLGDRGVEILDPATGTGTFITELIEYLPPQQLEYKYENEIHCNEVSILPYYIANLNIEYTYKQKMGVFREFENICFVDTLDNMGFDSIYGPQMNFFGIMEENAIRIGRQNGRKISVIIGNPPYNANQASENENNKNRNYPVIDKRIKNTYIANSSAQKTKMYDMYARFYRWASDRLDKNGIIAFITNSSFLDSRTFDGFRKVIADEFSYIYILDLGGNVRRNPKISGTTHNVFGIQTGVTVAFLIRHENKGRAPAQILYARRPEFELASEKLEYLRSTKMSEIRFDHLHPDKMHNWLNQEENNWDDLMQLASKEGKAKKGTAEPRTIFKYYSTGISTNRDEWIVDVSVGLLEKKMRFFINAYDNQLSGDFDTTVKWSRNLKRRFERKLRETFESPKIQRYSYRPFGRYYLYYSDLFVDEMGVGKDVKTQNDFPILGVNLSEKRFACLVSNFPMDLHFIGDNQCLPFYRYLESGSRVDNVTNWSLGQFQKHYKDKQITKEDIFHYVYAVLHHPAYRAKYEINLKREFPRIPFYGDFWKWADWGRRLMDLHLNYESADPYPLERVESGRSQVEGQKPVARLIARKEAGSIEVDTATTLRGVPAEGVPPGHVFGPGVDPGALQGKETQRSDHRREVQHLPLCRVQGAGDRPFAACLHGQRGDDEDCERDAVVSRFQRTGGFLVSVTPKA